MQAPDHHADTSLQSDGKPPTARIVLGVLVLLVVAGALHLAGVLPPGG